MTKLQDADALYLGADEGSKAYLGATLVWQKPVPPSFGQSIRFDTTGHHVTTIPLAGTGLTNFTMQALVYVEGGSPATWSQYQDFMVQNVETIARSIFASTMGSFGDQSWAIIGGGTPDNERLAGPLPVVGYWYLVTLRGDGTTGPSGVVRITAQRLDGTGGLVQASAGKEEFSAGSIASSTQFGCTDAPWADGIRIAEMRGYTSYRSDGQIEADLTNADPTGSAFWFRVTDDGAGNPLVTDISGNSLVPTVVGGTLAAGPG